MKRVETECLGKDTFKERVTGKEESCFVLYSILLRVRVSNPNPNPNPKVHTMPPLDHVGGVSPRFLRLDLSKRRVVEESSHSLPP